MTHGSARSESAGDSLDPLALLLRGFAVEFLSAQQWSSLERVMAPGYRLNVGGFVLEGRDTAYRAAMIPQFQQFPGLCVTLHDVLLGERHLAIRFTEHGASLRDGGLRAAWQGVALFRAENGRLVEGWAEEDYFSRKRQLRSGVCDCIESPHPAPFDQRALPADADTEARARAWLADPRAVEALMADPAAQDGADPLRDFLIERTEVDVLFAAGARAAFHATFRGGLRAAPDAGGGREKRPAVLRAAGIVTMRAGLPCDARIVFDRLGFTRALR